MMSYNGNPALKMGVPKPFGGIDSMGIADHQLHLVGLADQFHIFKVADFDAGDRDSRQQRHVAGGDGGNDFRAHFLNLIDKRIQ